MTEIINTSTPVAFTRTFTEETTLTCSSVIPDEAPQTGIAAFSVSEVGIDPPNTRRGVGTIVEVTVQPGTYEIAFVPHTPGYTGTIEIG